MLETLTPTFELECRLHRLSPDYLRVIVGGNVILMNEKAALAYDIRNTIPQPSSTRRKGMRSKWLTMMAMLLLLSPGIAAAQGTASGKAMSHREDAAGQPKDTGDTDKNAKGKGRKHKKHGKKGAKKGKKGQQGDVPGKKQ